MRYLGYATLAVVGSMLAFFNFGSKSTTSKTSYEKLLSCFGETANADVPGTYGQGLYYDQGNYYTQTTYYGQGTYAGDAGGTGGGQGDDAGGGGDDAGGGGCG